MSKSHTGKNILLTFTLFNPVIIFLLFKSFFISFISFLFAYVIISFFSKKSKIAYVYIVNFILLISLLFHSEVLFKYSFSEYVIPNLYEIKNGFYFNKPKLLENIKDKEYEIFYKTNKDGYRIPEALSHDKEIKQCDWLFIGDSFTQGAQVEYQNLYTTQLYNKHPDKVILNAGISGFGIVEEYNYYKNKGHKLKPKKVFLQICSFNDFMNIRENNNKFSDYLTQYSDLARFLLFNLKYKSPEELSLGRWVEPFCKEKKDNENYNVFFKKKSENQLNDLKIFEKYLKLFKEEVEKNGSELIVILIPTKEQSYSRYLNEVTTAFHIEESEIDMLYPNKFLKKLCEDNNINLIDLLQKYKTSLKSVFFDYDEHLNEFGHYLTSEAISESISSSKKNKLSILSKNLLGDRYPTYVDGSNNNILYQSSRDGNSEILFNNKNMNNEIRLTYNNVDESHPILNKNKTIIAFTEGNSAGIKHKCCLP